MTKTISQKIALIAIILISLFGMNLEESKAQPPCATGYTSAVLVFTSFGCEYEVRICYKCAIQSHQTSELYIYSYRPINPLCTQTKTDEEILENLTNKGIEFFLTNCVPKPCDQLPKYRVMVNQYACWKRLFIDKSIVPCETNAICQTLYEICYDDNTGYVTTNLGSNWQFGSTPNCNWPIIPGRVPFPNPNEPETVCVRLKTDCD